MDKEYTITFSQQEEAVLEFISLWLVNGKRPHELILLYLLMNKQSISKYDFENELSKYGGRYSEKDYISALNLLDMDFINTQSEKKKYSTLKFFDEQAMRAGSINRADSYMQWLKNLAFRKEVDSLIKYGLKKYNDCYRIHDDDNLVL